MLNYLSTFTNQNGLAFPDTAAIDASGGAATDGTEFIAAMVNDSMWGVWQALLNYVGLTPNGITESNGSSQVLEALRRFSIPGMMIHAVWNDDPATLGIRALQLTGQGILRANYAELDAVIYVGDTDNPTAAAFYHADDAAGTIRNTAGAYLILPDARGRVYRTLDLTGSVDPDGAGRELGDEQDDAMQRITGRFGNIDGQSASGGAYRDISTDISEGVFTDVEGRTTGESSTAESTRNTYYFTFDSASSTSPNPAKTDDTESRMINLAANGFITF